MANDEQREYWNDQAGPKWVEHQKRLDGMLGPITAILLDAIDAQPGERIIDIGCGTGEISWGLAERGADVLGVDVSGPMVEAARARGEKGASFVVADAAEHQAETPFDAAVSRFGVMFFDEPAAAFGNIRKNVTEGGRLVFACWREPASNPWAIVPAMAVMPLLDDPTPPDPLAPGPFAFADESRVAGILEQAGFQNIAIDRHDVDVLMSEGGLDDATEFACQIGPGARALGELDKEGRAKARAAIREALAPHVSDDGRLQLGGSIWLVSARA